jgi:probable F420-dependent oxidoreductase
MKVDGKLTIESLPQVIASAREHEASGYSGLWSSESKHDPFLPLVLSAEHTERIELGTSIAVAFARSPMTLAYTAWDLQQYSEGRFLLGLGSQVKAHIERRFSMPWSRPAARMRELISAIRAIWESWDTGDRLAFEGDFYSHTLMTPFFSPGPPPNGHPRIVAAAVGEAMSEVAGEVCDGIFLHGFTTERYIREVTLPAVHRGMERSGRSMEDFEVFGLPLTATGPDEAAMTAAIDGVRAQIAFYGSTPAYHGVLELHGWGDLGQELHALSRTDDPDRWMKMASLIDDDVLDAFAIVGEPDAVASRLSDRYDEVMDRLQFYAPYKHDPAMWTPAIAELTAS